MPSSDWLRLRDIVDRLKAIQRFRLYAEIAGIVVICAVSFGYCHSLKNEGADVERLRQLSHVADSAIKASRKSKSDADKERKVQDSLRLSLTRQDVIVRDSKQTELRARRKYDLLRDSLRRPHPVTPNPRLALMDTSLVRETLDAADSALEASHRKAALLETKIGTLEADTASKAREIFSLRKSLDSKDEAIRALNKSVEVQTRRLRRRKLEGYVENVLSFGFGYATRAASER